MFIKIIMYFDNMVTMNLPNLFLFSQSFPENFNYQALRKRQMTKWAHEDVAAAVAAFKKGENSEAFSILKKALHLDADNVEAFVAKGAL